MQQETQPQEIFDLPENLKKTPEELMLIANSSLPFIQDRTSTIRQYRLALARVLLTTLENKAIKRDGIAEKIDTEEQGINQWMKNFTRRYRKAEGVPFVLVTTKSPENKKIGGYSLDTNQPPEETDQTEDKTIEDIIQEVRETCSQITELIERDRTLLPEENAYFIDPSINIESKLKEIEESVERISTFQAGDRTGFAEHNCKILKILLEYTKDQKVVLPEEIAKRLELPLAKATIMIRKLAESLARSDKTNLRIKFERKPNDARFSGYFLDIENPEGPKITTMTPQIKEIPKTEKSNLLSTLRLAKTRRFAEKSNALIPNILDLLIKACIKNKSITAEYCLHKFKDRQTSRNYQDTLVRLQKTAEEERLGFRLIQEDRQWQAIPSPDAEETPEFAEKLTHKLSSNIPHTTEYRETQITPRAFRKRVNNSLRHFQSKNPEILEKVFNFILEKSIQGQYTTMGEIAENIEGLNKNYSEMIEIWLKRIREINADTKSGKHPSILGYTVIQEGPGKYKFIPVKQYKTSESDYTGRAKTWPTPIGKTPEIDEITLNTILDDLNKTPVKKTILEIYIEYARKRLSISSKIVTEECQKRGVPLNDPHIQIYNTHNDLEETYPSINFVKHGTYNYYVECKKPEGKQQIKNKNNKPKRPPAQTKRIDPEIGISPKFLEHYLSRLFDVSKNGKQAMFQRILKTLTRYRENGRAMSRDLIISQANVEVPFAEAIIGLSSFLNTNPDIGLKIVTIKTKGVKFYTIEANDSLAIILKHSDLLKAEIEQVIKKNERDTETLEKIRTGYYKKTYRYVSPHKQQGSDPYAALINKDLFILTPGSKEYRFWEETYGLREGEVLVKFVSANGKSPIIRAPEEHLVQL